MTLVSKPTQLSMTLCTTATFAIAKAANLQNPLAIATTVLGDQVFKHLNYHFIIKENNFDYKNLRYILAMGEVAISAVSTVALKALGVSPWLLTIRAGLIARKALLACATKFGSNNKETKIGVDALTGGGTIYALAVIGTLNPVGISFATSALMTYLILNALNISPLQTVEKVIT